MLDTLFTTALDMSVKGTLVILFVLLARLMLRRAPKVISYGLWLVVLLRLLCPVSVQLPVSVLPEVTPITPNYGLDNADLSFAEVGAAAIGSVEDMVSGGSGVQQIPVKPQTDPQNPVQQPQEQPVQYISTSAKDIWIFLCAYLWIAGLAAMTAYSLITTLRLKRNLREAVMIEKGVYQTDHYDTPFVMGLFVPKIYLPLGLEGKEKLLILAHEKQHIRRMDPVWKALGFLALSIHWFNPLVWVAFACACRDMEMSCDEAVLKNVGEDVRGEYAASLLKVTTGRRVTAGAPLAFGEGDPKGRIRNLARWKKPVLWISVVAVTACAVLAVCLLTDPLDRNTVSGGNAYFVGQLDVLEDDRMTLHCEDGSEIMLDVKPEFAFSEDVQPGDYVIARGRWNEANKRYHLTAVEEIEPLSHEKLEEAIENAILRVESNPKRNQYACASFATVGNEHGSPAAGNKGDAIVTVYGFALHQIYSNRNGKLQETSGSHIPVAITFRVDSEGRYRLASYWMPRDGSYYADDIRAKFPGGHIPDGQKYIAAQKTECEEKAKAHFGIGQQEDTEATVPPTTEQVYGFDISKVPVDDSLPIEALPQGYSREDAIRDGVAVMEYESAYANGKVWETFVKNVEAGTPAKVRVMNCAMGVVLRIEDILFDGEYFLVQRAMYYTDGRYAETLEFGYDYLTTFSGERKDDEGRVYESYIRYGLTVRDPAGREPQWEEWHTGGDIIAFQYRTEYKINPDIPETLVSAKLMLEDLTMGTVSSAQKLESLRNMLANAEGLGGGVDFAMEELYMDLTFSDGTKLQVTMFPEHDRMVLDGKVYDYGPWDIIKKDGDQDYVADYNALLDLVRHFGLEDWPEEFRRWCMDRGMEPPRHSLKVLVGEEPHP